MADKLEGMSSWQEKLAHLKSKGGFKAAAFWAVKKLFRMEVHFLYSIDLAQQQVLRPKPVRDTGERHAFHFIGLTTAQDLALYPHALIEQLDSQSGQGVARLISSDTGVYALIEGTSVVSQVNINRSAVVHVDSPTELDIRLAPGNVFLGYLFTYPQYRGMGTAASLIGKVSQDIQKRGYSRILTHIRSTNAASLNTFRKCGWFRVGWILTSTSGRLLLTRCPHKSGISITAARRL
ncbi:GNAT family N-acetyltransferase [Nitrosomonas sp. HPC101]|uniref:GNAT family N-acetyltransferase n=1 Tax=Nitrosomonas sp. HPC101 TaxID=1658667 RepID=UPI001369A1E7|nr:GNAT family N-acetyltransferase [Nitrosomonas sp. HPC101]